MLTVDGKTSFLQLMDVQNVHKMIKLNVSVQTRVTGNALFKMVGIILNTEGFVHTFNLFVCSNRNKFTLVTMVV